MARTVRSSPATRVAMLAASAALALPLAATGQNCGWSRVDHRVNYDASGIWSPNVYRSVVGALTVAEVGGAFWEGAETRVGKTLWQGMDSQIIATVAATYALLLLPLYVSAGRIRNQRHWQTDVAAGWVVGGLSGWYAHSRDVPILIEVLPQGFRIGYSKQF